MNVPDGMTTQEVLDVMDNVANRLAHKFRFGYHEAEDIKQQAHIFALEGLNKYEPIDSNGKERPLENFLWTHVRNRLFNYKRDNYRRPNLPCHSCPLKCYTSQTDSCELYSDKLECKWYSNWYYRNEAKHNLMHPIEIHSVRDEQENNMKDNTCTEEKIADKEILDIIDRELTDSDIRKSWLKIRYGIKVPKNKRIKVQEAIDKILENYS